MRARDSLSMEKCLQRFRVFQHRLAGGEVADPHAMPVRRRLDPCAKSLRECLLGGEALGEIVRRQAMALEALELRRTEDAQREALAVPLERGLDALDLDHVGADAENHFAACTIKRFISRTASRMTTKTARLTIAWPMCSSRTPFS